MSLWVYRPGLLLGGLKHGGIFESALSAAQNAISQKSAAS
jgi:hypothetical protein